MGHSPPGGYRALSAFQLATVIYDATVSFCDRFIDARSRLVDQMVQAARCGRQNIAEESRAGLLAPDTEKRLKNVARASLDELLLDYEDYLRQRSLPQWKRDQPEAEAVLRVWKERRDDPAVQVASSSMDWRRLDDLHREWYAPWLGEGATAIIQANALICLINQANYRLDRALQQHAVRLTPPEENPCCPVCGAAMVMRTKMNASGSGNQFWGCSRSPDCRGTRPR